MSNFKNTTAKGKSLEDEIADIYRELDGTIKVEQNIIIAGIQVDVYVEVMSNDGIVNQYAIDAKNYDSNVKAEEVRKCINDFLTMKMSHKIDQGIIIAKLGFTADGVTAAKEANIRLITIKELRKRTLDFSQYLNRWIDFYENEDLKRMAKYLPLAAKNESLQEIGILDDYLLKWLKGNGQHITILGNYGTGKSTTLKHLMWTQAKRYLNNPDEERIPIFVELKGYRQAPKCRQLITDILVNEFELNIKFSKFQSLNSKGRFLIIFDGFDEMIDKVIDGHLEEHFNDLSTLACENSKVILSCRTHYFKDHDQVLNIHNEKTELYQDIEGRIGYQIIFLNSFKEKDINEYLKAYFKEEWETYKEIIRGTYDLYSLAETPILLNMIVETLPEMKQEMRKVNRPAIYETFTNKWLRRDNWRRALHIQDRMYFCEQLALHFYISQVNSVHWSALPKYIKEYFGEKVRTNTELDIFDSDVRTSNFLKRKEESGEYSFIHKSFMEYFVARHFHNSIKQKIVDGLDSLQDITKSLVIYEFILEMLDDEDVSLLKEGIVVRINDKKNQIYHSAQSIGNCVYFLYRLGVSLKNSSLDTASLTGFTIKEVSFEKSSLGSANLRNCKLSNVSFVNAILSYSNFDNAILENVDFTGCTLTNASFINTAFDTKTIESLAKSRFWGSAKINVSIKDRIDKFSKKPGDLITYKT